MDTFGLESGHTDAIDGPDPAVEIAKEIGYLVMLRAGEGGKSMRLK